MQLEELEVRTAPATVTFGPVLVAAVQPQPLSSQVAQGLAALGLQSVQAFLGASQLFIPFEIAMFQFTVAQGNPTQGQTDFLLSQLGAQVAAYNQLLGMEQLLTSIQSNGA